MNICRKCSIEFKATDYQKRKSDFLCKSCRLEHESQYRQKRRESGNPIKSTKLPREWHRIYEQDYYANPKNKRRRAEQMRKYAKNPELRHKHIARWITQRAIKTGKLIKTPCQICGEIKVEAHHQDYYQPLLITWLCKIHHLIEHAKATGT
jgi:hypothetical protein